MDDMVEEILTGMDEFPFEFTDHRLINPDGSLNTGWMWLDPLLRPSNDDPECSSNLGPATL